MAQKGRLNMTESSEYSTENPKPSPPELYDMSFGNANRYLYLMIRGYVRVKKEDSPKFDGEREKLIEELRQKQVKTVDDYRDFILADRRRVVEPLVKAKSNKEEPYIWDAVDQTLKNAGIGD